MNSRSYIRSYITDETVDDLHKLLFCFPKNHQIDEDDNYSSDSYEYQDPLSEDRNCDYCFKVYERTLVLIGQQKKEVRYSFTTKWLLKHSDWLLGVRD